MKRKLTVLLVSILTFVMALSLAACNSAVIPGPGPDPKPDKPAKVEPDARYQTDTRTDAYTAYKADGTEIGKFKTIAAAINAAVATDSFGSDNTVRQLGSYVENNGVTVFQNQNGFTDSNNDQFWFYVDGTKLEGYDCYDGAMYADYLKNNKVITHNVTGFGSTVRQYHNGYALYNPDGTLNEGGEAAQSWELSSTMDAAVLGLPARLKGITGLNYEIDLTNVQIKPNYENTDDTYAFIGYYAWQDYYVIATGIACNVATGAWYPFEGSSRDDSFSDVTYNIGDSPLMISTWNEDGGYWVPEYTTLKTSIKTVGKSDELGDYYVSESKYEFYTAEGELDNEYTVIIDEEKVGNYFANTAFDANTTYAFIAGLDIRTPTSVSVFSYNTDYTNGAEFKNLTVVNATVHIPSAEELPDTDYGMLINPDWRGNDYNALMASGEHVEGVYDYNILNTYACASYAKENGKDVYTFSYAKDNSSTEALGGKAAEYQAKIDQLGEATEDTVVGMEDLINEVAAMYGTDFTSATSTIAQKYYLVLDFSPLKYAQDLFAQVATLSEDAEAYVEAFNKLPSLLSYEYVGWSTTEEEDAGYLMNDVADFTALYNQYYNKLTETDVQSIKYHLNSIDNYNMYVDLMNKADGYFTPGFKFMAKAEASDATQSEFTGEQAYADIALYLNKILNGTNWGTDPVGDNDDPNNAGAKFLNSDNNWLPSYHVLFLKARLEDAGYELPLYLSNLLTVCGEEAGFTEDFEYLDTVLTLAAGIEKGTIVIVNDEVAAMVNSVMVGKDKFKEAGLNWNFNASGVDFAYRAKAYKAYYGLDTGTPLATYIKSVQDFLVARVGAEVDGALAIKEEVSAQKVEVSEAAQAVMNLFTTTNIYGSAFDAYDAAMAEYKKLSAEDQAIVAQLSAFNDIVEMIEGNKNSLAAIDLTDVDPISVYKTIYYNGETEIVEMSATDALYQLNDLLCRMEAQVTFSYEKGETDNATKDSVYPTMNFDNVAFPSIRIVVLRQYFEAAGIKLPTYFNEIYTKIAYDTFYQSYNSIYQTVRLAATYAQEGKTVADMTEEDKAIFEKYWGPDYPLDKDALLQWNWNSGNKFETYFSTRVAGIALQYYLASGNTLEERFVVPKTVTWIYGDLMAEYEYKGVKYLAHVYEDEAEALDRTYGALMNGYWDATLLYVDAEGNLCSEDAEGAKLLTTETEGVTKTEKANWQENCAGDATKVYQTADGQLVYKPRVWRPAESGGAYINYDAPGFVDACNRPVELSEEELAQVTVVGTVKVYKFYDVLGAWLQDQGYTVKANGWGYQQAPTAE